MTSLARSALLSAWPAIRRMRSAIQRLLLPKLGVRISEADRSDRIQIEPEEHVYLPRSSARTLPRNVAKRAGNWILEPTWAAVVIDGAIYNDGVVAHGKTIVATGAGDEVLRAYLSLRDALDIVRGPSGASQPGSCLPLTGRWDSNYYHWIVEILPRLRVLERFDDLGEIWHLVPCSPTAWQRDSLSLLGVREEACQRWQGAPVRCDRVLAVSSTFRVVAPGAPFSLPGPSALRWLRGRIVEACTASGGEERLYISRAHAQSRRLLNEDELLRALEPLGFKRVLCERLSFAEQVRLFNGATTIVAPHGAGLTNLVFAGSANVVEIAAPNSGPQFYELCGLLGHDHALVSAERFGSDMRVEPKDVIAAVHAG